VLGSAVGADDYEDWRRGLLFEATYERPFSVGYVLPRPSLASPILYGGQVSFRLHKEEGASAVGSHTPGQLNDCGSQDVHFCIDGGLFSLAVPPRGARGDWSVTVRDQEFRLISTRRIHFRGRDIEVVRIKGIDPRFQTQAWFFVFSYDVGLIAFADVTAADLRPKDNHVPDALAGAAVLASEHGLGGRDYCRHWKCGPMPPAAR
jgi:hypothetical protein